MAVDNILYQKTEQKEAVLNVPEIVTRNTFYYSNFMFKKALFLQTGISLNYFSSYYGNEYNPVIGGAFVQNDKQIGNHQLIFCQRKNPKNKDLILKQNICSLFYGE